MKGKKGRISLSLGFWVVAALLIYMDGAGVLFRWIAACVLHELGHLAAIKSFRGKVRALRITAVGAEMELDQQSVLSYGREAGVALAGPAVNLLLAICTYLLGFYLFAGINLCLGVLNLLPVWPLDGGRFLWCVLKLFVSEKAEEVMGVISLIFTGAILGLGWAAWRGWGNLTLFAASLWLMFRAIKIFD